MSKINKAYIIFLLAIALALGVTVGNMMGKQESITRNVISAISSTGKIDYILRTIEESYVDTIDVDSITEKMIPILLEELDPHSTYIPAEELERTNEDLQGNFGGVGIQFRVFDDTVMVMHVIDGGPSQKVGIKDGDRIIAVDDSAMVGDGLKNDDVMDALRGERGTYVKVTAYRPSVKDTLDFNIKRGNIPVESVEVSYMLNKTIGYINVSRFGQNTYKEFLLALAQLKQLGAKSMIVDLRGNTGGYLGAAIQMINEFLKSGEMIVYTDGKSQKRQEYLSDGSGTCQNMRVAILLDEWSASASEIFAGAIQDNDRGIIIGRRSFGKGLVQSQIVLSDGSAIRLTISRYYTPSGRCIQKNYEKGSENYAEDLWNRFQHGEMDTKDSISFQNTKSFETKLGRKVYDSGGIMPDVFIPRDTTNVTKFFTKVVNDGLVVRYSFFYVDKNRDELTKIAKSGGVKALWTYMKEQNLFPDFMKLVDEKNVKYTNAELKTSRSMIETQLYAFIAQNVMDSEGFYPIIKDLDNTLIEAERIMGLSKQDFKAKMMENYVEK